MSAHAKVVWKEGMFLQPQHFQQHERYLLGRLHDRLSHLEPYGYGVSELEIDTSALSGGLFSLTKCSGILPDGTPFSIPRSDAAPASRAFSEQFTLERTHLDVYLALPAVLGGQVTVGAGARYGEVSCEVADEVAGGEKRTLVLAQPSFRLLFDSEVLDSSSVVRVARLVRDTSAGVVVDESIMAPLLRIAASRRLMDDLRSILQTLMASVTTLSQARRQGEGGLAVFSSGEENSFRLLSALNTYTPLLAHHHFTGTIHPFDFFCLLNQLAGALCTFSARLSLASMPRYEHEQCGATFRELFTMIREVVSTDRGAACQTLAVKELGRSSFRCDIADRSSFAKARFYLGVKAPVPEKELVVGVVQRIKVSSPERIDLLIASAMPGLRLMNTTTLPEDAAVKPGYVYFSLEQQGEFWDAIAAAGSIALYFPHEYSQLTMELLVLRGAGGR